MKIGTPLSPGATRVMLLGSGELGKEVIIALQRLGVEVIAVDRYANAPGHQVAHRAHVINMADGAALRALVEKERPHIIVPEIEAIATDMLAQIEKEGIATVIPAARAAQLTMNREGIRRLAAEELDLPTSRYAFAESVNEMKQAIDGGIGYPCIVKSVMSSSGKGQSTINGPDDVQKAWDYALSGGRVNRGRVIVEEMIRFDGSLYFANTSYIEDKVMDRVSAKPDLRYVIVVADGINQVDATGEDMLSHLVERLHAGNIEVLFTGLKTQVLGVFARTGFLNKIGPDRLFRTEDQALQYVWNKLGEGHEADCPLNIVCPVVPPKQ
jgi:phosphoribosylaminoimidazole carboxylase (NCAIR synthetase)